MGMQYISRPHPLSRWVARLAWFLGVAAVLWANLAAIAQAYAPLSGVAALASPFRFQLIYRLARILLSPIGILSALQPPGAAFPPRAPSPQAAFYREWWSFALRHALGANLRLFGRPPFVWELTLNLGLFLAVWGGLMVLARSMVRVPPPSQRLASSYWSTFKELGVYRDAAARPGSLPLGAVSPDLSRSPVELAIPFGHRFQHVEVLGLTGSGKTACVFKPWALRDGALNDMSRWGRAVSTVIVDIKHPDIYDDIVPYLAAQRRAVYVLAPDHPATTMCYNPLDALDPSDTTSYLTDIQTLVRTIVENSQQAEKDVPFHRANETDMLEQLVQLAYEAEAVVTPALLEQWEEDFFSRFLEPGQRIPRVRSLPFIALLCRLPTDTFLNFVGGIVTDPRNPDKWPARFAQSKTRTKADVTDTLAGLKRRLAPFLSPAVARVTQHSHFRLDAVGLFPTTLIIGPPAFGSEAAQTFSAIVITQLIQSLMRIARRSPGMRLPVPVMLYLDEIINQARIPGLDRDVATLRQYGIGIVLGLQNRAGLYNQYGRDVSKTILDNLRTKIIFGRGLPPDQTREVEELLGETTVLTHSASTGDRGSTMSEHVAKRPLMPGEEIRKMRPFEAIAVFPDGAFTRVRMPLMPRRDPDTGRWAYTPVEGTDVKTACAPLVAFIEGLERAGLVDRRFMEPTRSQLRERGLPDFTMLLTRLSEIGLPKELQPPPLPRGVLLLPAHARADSGDQEAEAGPLPSEIELGKIVEEAVRMGAAVVPHGGDGESPDGDGAARPASAAPGPEPARQAPGKVPGDGLEGEGAGATRAQPAPGQRDGAESARPPERAQAKGIDPERVMDEIRGMYNALLVRRDLVPLTLSPVAWRIEGHSKAALAVRHEVIAAYAKRRNVTVDRLVSVWRESGFCLGPARVRVGDEGVRAAVLLTGQAVRDDRLSPAIRAKIDAWPSLPASAVAGVPALAGRTQRPAPAAPPRAGTGPSAAPGGASALADSLEVLDDILRWAREHRDSLLSPGSDPVGQWEGVVEGVPALLVRGNVVWTILGQRGKDPKAVLGAWKDAGIIVTSSSPSDKSENRFTVLIKASDESGLRRGTRYVAFRWDQIERRGLARSA